MRKRSPNRLRVSDQLPYRLNVRLGAEMTTVSSGLNDSLALQKRLVSPPSWMAFGRGGRRALQPGRHALVLDPRRQPEAARHNRAERQREAQPDIFAEGAHQHRADRRAGAE